MANSRLVWLATGFVIGFAFALLLSRDPQNSGLTTAKDTAALDRRLKATRMKTHPGESDTESPSLTSTQKTLRESALESHTKLERIQFSENEKQQVTKEIAGQLTALRSLEVANVKQRLVSELGLSAAESAILDGEVQKISASELPQGDCAEMMAKYAEFIAADSDLQLDRRAGGILENQLLKAIGRRWDDVEAAVREKVSSNMMEAWAYRYLADFQLQLDMSEQQKDGVFTAITGLAKGDLAPLFAEGYRGTSPAETRMKVLKAIEPHLSQTQMQLIHSRWKASGMIETP